MNKINTSVSGRRELKKHVAAIHSCSKLTLIQRKIANALLFNAYDDLLSKDEHSIHVEELCSLIGYNSKDFNLVKNALKALLATVVEWNLVDKDRLDSSAIWNASTIIADASIDGPICTYSYSGRMRQLLYHPEVYGRININLLGKFKSTYGLALFENCVRYSSIKQTPWFDIELFRKLMGVAPDKYTVFRDFKRRIIDKAVKEVNHVSDMVVTYDLRKRARVVTQIKFNFTSKEKLKPVVSHEVVEWDLRSVLAKEFALSTVQVDSIFQQHNEDYIESKVKLIKGSKSYIEGAIKNLARYLMDALAKDYQAPVSSQKAIRQERPVNDKQRKQNLTQYQNYFKKELMHLVNGLNEKERNNLNKKFEDFISEGVYVNLYHKDGLANPLVADHFCKFMKGIKHPVVRSIANFDEYCSTLTEEPA